MEILLGAIAAIAGMAGWLVISMLLPRRRMKPVKPVCGCRHHHSFHEKGTGACHEHVRVNTSIGIYSRCGCQHYSGPEPIPSMYASEITDGRS